MTARRASLPQSQVQGRLLILTAALLWSLSGVFVPLLRSETRLGLHVPEVLPWHIAFFRVFFAGAVLVPLLKRRDVAWRPAQNLRRDHAAKHRADVDVSGMRYRPPRAR